MSETRAILHYAERPAHLPGACAASSLSVPGAARACGRTRIDVAAHMDSRLGIALAIAAARLAGHEAGSLRLDAAPGCKPRLAGGPDFSISHASGLVACAMLDDGAAVGCDIEAADAVLARDLRLVLHASERELITSGVLPPAVVWTRKEAALKWAGLGLRAVNDVCVSREGVSVAGRRLECHGAALPGRVVASIVTARSLAGVSVRWHDAITLLRALPAAIDSAVM